MNYYLIGLIIAVLIIVVLVIILARQSESLNYINGKYARLRNDYNICDKINQEAKEKERELVALSSSLRTIINSITAPENLKKKLRFKLPDGELARTVKAKPIMEDGNIVEMEYTVRKKEDNKYKDIFVEPFILED